MKQETLEEFIIREGYPIGSQQEIWEDGVRSCAKWQQERSYSDGEVLKILYDFSVKSYSPIEKEDIIMWFEQFKKI